MHGLICLFDCEIQHLIICFIKIYCTKQLFQVGGHTCFSLLEARLQCSPGIHTCIYSSSYTENLIFAPVGEKETERLLNH